MSLGCNERMVKLKNETHCMAHGQAHMVIIILHTCWQFFYIPFPWSFVHLHKDISSRNFSLSMHKDKKRWWDHAAVTIRCRTVSVETFLYGRNEACMAQKYIHSRQLCDLSRFTSETCTIRTAQTLSFIERYCGSLGQIYQRRKPSILMQWSR